ncbi:poly(A) polymerase [Artemisia annua]|uniref:polynucleotide adenylyltransferase n=1 Tax=Artemisia annua TaxID=35608 RepID=A0A2U1MBS3_ARTAN|nr:poly(A) polymerase [Artemisia annua]
MVSQAELDTSASLLKFISDEGLVASDVEEEKRKNVVDKLKEILMAWIKRVAYQRRLPPNQIKDASVTILPYGSYGLGVYNADSNIDLLCVGPCFASMAEDYFIVLHNMLAGRSEVFGIHCVKDVKVPLLRFTFEGIMIDLSFAKLQVAAVPENVDVSNPSFIKSIDKTSSKNFSGVRLKNSILQLVPDVKAFQELLRCVKLWAKRRGVYSDLFGLFGGTHLAILAALICEKNPSASLLDLISMFFKTFAFWPWPEPVILEEGATPKPPPLPLGTQALMTIQLPGSRNEYCHSNMTTSTFNKIRSEFRRGYRQTQDPYKPQFNWGNLFEPFSYSKSYLRFIKICLSAYNKDELGTWVHWVRSRIRTLLDKLEELHALCDPNPTEYIDLSIRVPNVVFYWGLVPGRGDNLDLNAATNDLMTNLSIGYQGNLGRMTLTIVHASQLSNLQLADDHIKTELSLCTYNHQQQMMPVYSTHSPHYVVGYLVTEGNPEHPHANGLSVEF